MSVMDALFKMADMRCTVCGAKMGACDCWERCSCGWSVRKGQMCRNPETGRCSIKVQRGKYNLKTKRYE